MTGTRKTVSNPDLTVGAGNKQRWNQPAHRRHGFHNAHRLFRRAFMARAARVHVLDEAEDPALAALPAVKRLTGRPELSALVCARGNRILLSRHAADFPADQPHSIQSISKLFVHVIAGKLVAEGLLDPARYVEHYLPGIGSGYRGATLRDVLDMNVINDFSEDYEDPQADCYAEEIALGWRLPPEGTDEITLRDFVQSITGDDLTNRAGTINYCSSNTDLLTVICDSLVPGGLPRLIEGIADAAGFAQAFHISLSRDGLPAFSGGGCLSAQDLARFGLLLARIADGDGGGVASPEFLRDVLTGATKTLHPPRDRVRYAGQMMTDGRWIGHAGYGGQFLMVDTRTGLSCAYLSVLENDAGYCVDYMNDTIAWLEEIVAATG